MIDSHCHLTDSALYPQIDDVLQRAEQAGVKACLSVACSANEWEPLLALLSKYPHIYGAVGLHPESLKDQKALKHIGDYLKHPGIVALGEMGLDAYYGADTLVAQTMLFEQQLELVQEYHLPAIIHTRQADEQTMQVMTKAFKHQPFAAVLHCFCGTSFMADWASEMGFYLSASGMITFKKADEIRDVFARVPLNCLLLETDSPYLAPVPFRGHVNEPAFVAHTAKALADIKGLSVAEIDTITTDNFRRLFLSS